MTVKDPQSLVLTYSSGDSFDKALKDESTKGHHSKCFYGNKAKIVAALSDDPNWHGTYAKFIPERKIATFAYGGNRFEQDLTNGEVEWLERFDTDQPVRSRTIVLDPNKARRTGPRKSTGGTRKSGSRKRGGCNSHTGENSGRAKRMRVLVQARMDHAAA
jgi:hypothetical protein